MLVDAGVDEGQVGARPFDGRVEPFFQGHASGEAEHLPSLERASETLAGVIPGTLGKKVERSQVSSQLVHPSRQVEDGGLHAARKVIDVAAPPYLGAGEQPTYDVIHVDEIAGGDPTVLDPQRKALQRAVDEGRRHVAPDRRWSAPPLSGPQHLARAVDVLEPRTHGG